MGHAGFFLFLVLVVAAGAEGQLARNGAYLELGGSAVVPSLNYERRVTDNWFARIGASVVTGENLDSSSADTDTTFVIPLTASRISHPTGSHHLEFGGGITIAAGDRQDLFDTDDADEQFSTVFATGILGYRYQKPGRGFQFRAAFIPIVGGGEILPWVGVSLGYAW